MKTALNPAVTLAFALVVIVAVTGWGGSRGVVVTIVPTSGSGQGASITPVCDCDRSTLNDPVIFEQLVRGDTETPSFEMGSE